MDRLDAGGKSSGRLLSFGVFIQWLFGDSLESQASDSKLRESIFVSKFTLESIVQVARSIGTKSLDTKVGFLV
jgi:hypothetical protein